MHCLSLVNLRPAYKLLNQSLRTCSNSSVPVHNYSENSQKHDLQHKMSDSKILNENVSVKDKSHNEEFVRIPYTLNRLITKTNFKTSQKRTALQEESFASLLRRSSFVQLGNFKGREVIGVVIENINNEDLYIDFGGKFHCVCKQPPNTQYPRGSLVRIRLKDVEMTNQFMINTKGISILEADAVLIGHYHRSRPMKASNDENLTQHSADNDNVSSSNWKI